MADVVVVQVTRMVSFTREVAKSFIALPPVNVEQDFRMSMTVKSQEKDGLIFYVADVRKLSS